MSQALTTYETPVLPEWVDYNGHLRDAFYLLVFSYATDALMAHIAWTARTATPADTRCSPWNAT